LQTGHEITTINDKFEHIDKKSKQLIIEKNKLTSLLKEAIDNDWKDSLLSKINS
jgi:predicted transcriptional regulator